MGIDPFNLRCSHIVKMLPRTRGDRPIARGLPVLHPAQPQAFVCEAAASDGKLEAVLPDDRRDALFRRRTCGHVGGYGDALYAERRVERTYRRGREADFDALVAQPRANLRLVACKDDFLFKECLVALYDGITGDLDVSNARARNLALVRNPLAAPALDQVFQRLRMRRALHQHHGSFPGCATDARRPKRPSQAEA